MEDRNVLAREATSCAQVLPELGRGDSAVVSSHNSGSLLVAGSLPPFADVRTLPIREGRFYNWEDVADARRVAFLGSDAKIQLFGSRPAIGESIRIRGLPYTVIGVMRHKEQDSSYDGRDISKVFIAVTAALRDFPEAAASQAGRAVTVDCHAQKYEEHERCKAQVRKTLARLHGFDPRDEEAVGIWDTVQQAKAFRQLTDGMKYFLGGVGVTSLLLGGIGVMNVMLVVVRERTRRSASARPSARHRGALCGSSSWKPSCGAAERRPGNVRRVRAMRRGQPTAVAGYFAGLLPTWGSAPVVMRTAGRRGGRLRTLPGGAGGRGRPDRGPSR